MATEQVIFETAIEIDEIHARNDYLDQACGDDAELRKRVTGLLAFYDDKPAFLSEEKLLADRHVEENMIGKRIGSYTLREQIGEGGFGVVYRAEQTEPIRRTVAVKIVKLGMDTHQIIARFEAERQALAMMDHPYIAHVLECGATSQGRPYFVMELVEGIPITDYCDTHRSTTTERLQLFTKVCRAIQHAHQKGIIHRDIKPSNVLVTREDDSDVPHIIDFGVSKAIGGKLSEHTNVTRQGQIIGTPQYMSPEQAEQSGIDVDTRSDIYSLGVLLYEMLTGQTPHDGHTLKGAAIDEMIRVIREDDPPTPSARFRNPEKAAAIVAKRRSTHVSELGRTLKGELDWIVMKALEKDRSRRFETASEVSADIERYLNDEPVQSGPASKTYRFGKFIRRNRGAVVAITIVMVALSVGLTVAVAGLLQANEERNRAIASETNAQTMLAMLRTMLETDPVTQRGRDLTVGQMLDDFAERLPDLSEQPEIAAEIHDILESSYFRLGYLNKSIEHGRREYELKRGLLGDNHRDVAFAASRLSQTLSINGDRAKALRVGTDAMRILDDLEDVSPRSNIDRERLAGLLIAMGQTEKAERLIRRALEIAKAHETTIHTISLEEKLAFCLCKQGRIDEGVEIARKSLTHMLQLHAADEEDIAWCRRNLAKCLTTAGKLVEAASEFEQAHEAMHRIHGPMSIFNPSVVDLANVYHRLFKLEDAESLLENSLDWNRFDGSEKTPDVFIELVLIKLDRGDYMSAQQLCRKAIDHVGLASESNHPRTMAMALLAISSSRYAASEFDRLCHDVITATEGVNRNDALDLALMRAWALAHMSQHEAKYVDECLSLADPLASSPLGWYLTAFPEHVAALGHAAADHDKQTAFEYYRRALNNTPKHRLFFSAEIERSFTRALISQGDDSSLREARSILEAGLEWREKLIPLNSVFLADARLRLASHLMDHGESAQDLQRAHRLLQHDSHASVIEGRPADDYFRIERLQLLEKLSGSNSR